jgi:hypothetical protein
MGKKRYFAPAVKLEVIQRFAAGESPSALAEEYSIRRTLVYQWAAVYREQGEAGLRGPGRPSRVELAAALVGKGPAASDPAHSVSAAQRRIALLEQKIAQQSLEIDFFKLALQHFETLPLSAARPGATAPTPSSGRKRSRKAD